jgi:probable phosphomutase (TIGR03848 family)
MPIILLIRHGETDYNKKMHIPGRLPNVHLNKKGQQQALLVAESLKDAPIKAIYASPMERTLETAEPLAKNLKLPVVPLPGLLETDCGEWQGQSVKKLRRQKIWKTIQLHPSLFHFPGGESIAECQHRMVQALETLRPQYSDQDVVACFSHSDPIKQVVAYYLGLSLDNFQRLAVDTASITVLFISDNGSLLFMLNHHPSFSWDALKPPQKPEPKSAGKP